MRTVGIIGGIGPESTVDYYRSIIASYRDRTRDGSYPSIVINSIDVRRMLDLVGANTEEQVYIDDKYMNELLRGTFIPETQAGLLAIVERMKTRHGIQGLILGGTELPLILRSDEHAGVQFLDTTRLHVEAIVSRLLS